MTRIRTALISVSEKHGVMEFAAALHEKGIRIISTGGTAKAIQAGSIPVREISTVTGFPEIMDGRVKTLHPAIHAGILARRDHPDDIAVLEEHRFTPIDLVVVNLYPFDRETARDIGFEQALEHIDIGGPTLIRAAAKNFLHVAVVVDPNDYDTVIREMELMDGSLSLSMRWKLAGKAFQHTARYDAHICRYLSNSSLDGHQLTPPDRSEALPNLMVAFMNKARELRYGENPQQEGALYVDSLSPAGGWADADQLGGKELSYNNYLDMDAAWRLVSEFQDCGCVIVKHGNPCGAATAPDCIRAYQMALETDPDSAFGSIVAFNRRVNAACATELYKLFVEVIIAPDFEHEALTILQRKKKLRLIRKPVPLTEAAGVNIRDIEGAYLVQTPDRINLDSAELTKVTVRKPDTRQMEDLIFAWKCVKHVKSNAIVFARNNRLLGVGAGQMSRVDSVRLAALKSRISLAGAVMASDAFLPFRDALDVAAEAGIVALIQPGGSIRDEEVISAANERGVAMIFTGRRHFRH
ncbi:MAG: bifunctional phosphoribosylaminoimidazolecarboxamide formyltransferase/IMP cyclohydrolase [Acidobacteria bacterium]|nr:bifunctional phosphoribosylaminoimidazolecarboxamide formyltransferase/IMP cyclohydrolase [Acidobacteriota bacterium]